MLYIKSAGVHQRYSINADVNQNCSALQSCCAHTNITLVSAKTLFVAYE